MSVKTIVIDKVKGRELPPGWAERAEVRPDEEVQVAIGPSREEAARELVNIMDRMGKEAQKRGLTEEKLAELLKDNETTDSR